MQASNSVASNGAASNSQCKMLTIPYPAQPARSRLRYKFESVVVEALWQLLFYHYHIIFTTGHIYCILSQWYRGCYVISCLLFL